MGMAKREFSRITGIPKETFGEATVYAGEREFDAAASDHG